MFRQNTYNESDFCSMVPIHRQQVVPGQSVALDIKVAWETPPFLQNILTGGVCSLYTFYVPHRLVWDQWVDFIADPESGLTVPTTTEEWGLLYEAPPAGEAVTSLFRRGYKLAYNQFFGSEQYGAVWYADITDDSDTTRLPVRGLDQFLTKIVPSSQVSNPTYEAPVTGTAPNQIASIALNEFRQQMRQARSVRRADMTGEKYVDSMLRMGVKLDWRVQLAPELVGMAHYDFDAKETRASYTPPDPTTGARTGQAFARYAGEHNYKLPRKFFAEHGYLFTVIVIRPNTWDVHIPFPIDSQPKDYGQFWLGDNQTGTDDWPAGWFWQGGGATPVFTPRFQWLLSGQNLKGDVSASSWFQKVNPTNLVEAVYPTPQTGQSAILDQSFAVHSRIKAMGPTPVRTNVF
jgi:hypothetical protein